jgi:hypothetical protein
VVANFNSLIDAARGEYWTCLPDDDLFHPDFLERSMGALDRHPECDFTFADHRIIRVDGVVDEARGAANSRLYGRTSLRDGVYPHPRLFELALNQSICLQTAVFRRAMIASLRFVPGITTLDHSLFLRMGAGATPFCGYYVNERLMDYRLHATQWSSTTQRIDFLRAEIASFESVPQVPAPHLRAFNDKLGRRYLTLALLEAEQGATGAARAHALRSLGLSKNVRGALGALLAFVAPGAVTAVRRLNQLRRR